MCLATALQVAYDQCLCTSASRLDGQESCIVHYCEYLAWLRMYMCQAQGMSPEPRSAAAWPTPSGLTLKSLIMSYIRLAAANSLVYHSMRRRQ